MPNYAGVNLEQPSQEILDLIAARANLKDIIPFEPLPYLNSFQPEMPYLDQRARPIRLGSLWWPQGATRWATAYYLASESDLAQIRGSVGVYNAAPMTLGDGTNVVTVNMYMLPARPLFQCPPDVTSLSQWILPKTFTNGQPLYLLALVDQRYFWWQAPNPVKLADTWSGLLTNIGTALGVGITSDDVDSVYLEPYASLAKWVNYPALMLDKVAMAIGQRVTVSLAGQVVLQSSATASGIAAANLAASTTRMGGGIFALEPTSPVSDTAPLMPAKVLVAFEGTASYTKTVTLASLGLGYQANPKTVMTLPSNQSSDDFATTYLDDLAIQIATDFYNWQLSKIDLIMPGMIAWPAEATSDYVEYCHVGPMETCHVWTRVQRDVKYAYTLKTAAPSPVVQARFVTQSLPSFTASNGILTANTNGALGSSNCDGVAAESGDVFLYCLEGYTGSVNYMVYALTQGTSLTPWIATPVSANAWILAAASQVWIGPEGTNDKNTVWQVTTPNAITPGTTAVLFARSYQELRVIQVTSDTPLTTGVYAANVYFMDGTLDTSCYSGDWNSNVPSTAVYYWATRGFNKTISGTTKGFYKTFVSDNVVLGNIECVSGTLEWDSGPAL